MASKVVEDFRSNLREQGSPMAEWGDGMLISWLHNHHIRPNNRDIDEWGPEFAKEVRDLETEAKPGREGFLGAFKEVPAGIESSVERKIGSYQAVSGMVGGSLGADEFEDDMMLSQRRRGEKAHRVGPSITDIEMLPKVTDPSFFPKLGRWGLGVGAEVTVDALELLGSWGLGRVVGGAAAASKVSKAAPIATKVDDAAVALTGAEAGATKAALLQKLAAQAREKGQFWGSMVGVVGTSTAQNTGQVYSELYPYTQLPEDDELYLEPATARAMGFGAGLASGALDSAAPLYLFGAMAKKLGRGAAVGLIGRMMEKIPAGMIFLPATIEAGTEASQEFIQMLTVKHHSGEPWGPQDWNRMKNAGAMGFVGGGVLGGGAHGVQKLTHKIKEGRREGEKKSVSRADADKDLVDSHVTQALGMVYGDFVKNSLTKKSGIVRQNFNNGEIEIEYADGTLEVVRASHFVKRNDLRGLKFTKAQMANWPEDRLILQRNANPQLKKDIDEILAKRKLSKEAKDTPDEGPLGTVPPTSEGLYHEWVEEEEPAPKEGHASEVTRFKSRKLLIKRKGAKGAADRTIAEATVTEDDGGVLRYTVGDISKGFEGIRDKIESLTSDVVLHEARTKLRLVERKGETIFPMNEEYLNTLSMSELGKLYEGISGHVNTLPAKNKKGWLKWLDQYRGRIAEEGLLIQKADGYHSVADPRGENTNASHVVYVFNAARGAMVHGVHSKSLTAKQVTTAVRTAAKEASGELELSQSEKEHVRIAALRELQTHYADDWTTSGGGKYLKKTHHDTVMEHEPTKKALQTRAEKNIATVNNLTDKGLAVGKFLSKGPFVSGDPRGWKITSIDEGKVTVRSTAGDEHVYEGLELANRTSFPAVAEFPAFEVEGRQVAKRHLTADEDYLTIEIKSKDFNGSGTIRFKQEGDTITPTHKLNNALLWEALVPQTARSISTQEEFDAYQAELANVLGLAKDYKKLWGGKTIRGDKTNYHKVEKLRGINAFEVYTYYDVPASEAENALVVKKREMKRAPGIVQAAGANSGNTYSILAKDREKFGDGVEVILHPIWEYDAALDEAAPNTKGMVVRKLYLPNLQDNLAQGGDVYYLQDAAEFDVIPVGDPNVTQKFKGKAGYQWYVNLAEAAGFITSGTKKKVSKQGEKVTSDDLAPPAPVINFDEYKDNPEAILALNLWEAAEHLRMMTDAEKKFQGSDRLSEYYTTLDNYYSDQLRRDGAWLSYESNDENLRRFNLSPEQLNGSAEERVGAFLRNSELADIYDIAKKRLKDKEGNLVAKPDEFLQTIAAGMKWELQHPDGPQVVETPAGLVVDGKSPVREVLDNNRMEKNPSLVPSFGPRTLSPEFISVEDLDSDQVDLKLNEQHTDILVNDRRIKSRTSKGQSGRAIVLENKETGKVYVRNLVLGKTTNETVASHDAGAGSRQKSKSVLIVDFKLKQSDVIDPLNSNAVAYVLSEPGGYAHPTDDMPDGYKLLGFLESYNPKARFTLRAEFDTAQEFLKAVEGIEQPGTPAQLFLPLSASPEAQKGNPFWGKLQTGGEFNPLLTLYDRAESQKILDGSGPWVDFMKRAAANGHNGNKALEILNNFDPAVGMRGTDFKQVHRLLFDKDPAHYGQRSIEHDVAGFEEDGAFLPLYHAFGDPRMEGSYSQDIQKADLTVLGGAIVRNTDIKEHNPGSMGELLDNGSVQGYRTEQAAGTIVGQLEALGLNRNDAEDYVDLFFQIDLETKKEQASSLWSLHDIITARLEATPGDGSVAIALSERLKALQTLLRFLFGSEQSADPANAWYLGQGELDYLPEKANVYGSAIPGLKKAVPFTRDDLPRGEWDKNTLREFIMDRELTAIHTLIRKLTGQGTEDPVPMEFMEWAAAELAGTQSDTLLRKINQSLSGLTGRASVLEVFARAVGAAYPETGHEALTNFQAHEDVGEFRNEIFGRAIAAEGTHGDEQAQKDDIAIELSKQGQQESQVDLFIEPSTPLDDASVDANLLHAILEAGYRSIEAHPLAHIPELRKENIVALAHFMQDKAILNKSKVIASGVHDRALEVAQKIPDSNFKREILASLRRISGHPLLKATKVKFYTWDEYRKIYYQPKNTYVRGYFEGDTIHVGDTHKVFPDDGTGRGDSATPMERLLLTLVEEMGHAITSQIIDASAEVAKTDKMPAGWPRNTKLSKADLKRIHKDTKVVFDYLTKEFERQEGDLTADVQRAIRAALKDSHEMWTHLLVQPEFRAWVKTKELPRGLTQVFEKKSLMGSLYDWFVRLISRFTGRVSESAILVELDKQVKSMMAMAGHLETFYSTPVQSYASQAEFDFEPDTTSSPELTAEINAAARDAYQWGSDENISDMAWQVAKERGLSFNKVRQAMYKLHAKWEAASPRQRDALMASSRPLGSETELPLSRNATNAIAKHLGKEMQWHSKWIVEASKAILEGRAMDKLDEITNNDISGLKSSFFATESAGLEDDQPEQHLHRQLDTMEFAMAKLHSWRGLPIEDTITTHINSLIGDIRKIFITNRVNEDATDSANWVKANPETADRQEDPLGPQGPFSEAGEILAESPPRPGAGMPLQPEVGYPEGISDTWAGSITNKGDLLRAANKLHIYSDRLAEEGLDYLEAQMSVVPYAMSFGSDSPFLIGHSSETPLPLPVEGQVLGFHGTGEQFGAVPGHPVGRPDIAYAGTGEGGLTAAQLAAGQATSRGQMIGFGLYVGGAEEVGESYKKQQQRRNEREAESSTVDTTLTITLGANEVKLPVKMKIEPSEFAFRKGITRDSFDLQAFSRFDELYGDGTEALNNQDRGTPQEDAFIKLVNDLTLKTVKEARYHAGDSATNRISHNLDREGVSIRHREYYDLLRLAFDVYNKQGQLADGWHESDAVDTLLETIMHARSSNTGYIAKKHIVEELDFGRDTIESAYETLDGEGIGTSRMGYGPDKSQRLLGKDVRKLEDDLRKGVVGDNVDLGAKDFAEGIRFQKKAKVFAKNLEEQVEQQYAGKPDSRLRFLDTQLYRKRIMDSGSWYNMHPTYAWFLNTWGSELGMDPSLVRLGKAVWETHDELTETASGVPYHFELYESLGLTPDRFSKFEEMVFNNPGFAIQVAKRLEAYVHQYQGRRSDLSLADKKGDHEDIHDSISDDLGLGHYFQSQRSAPTPRRDMGLAAFMRTVKSAGISVGKYKLPAEKITHGPRAYQVSTDLDVAEDFNLWDAPFKYQSKKFQDLILSDDFIDLLIADHTTTLLTKTGQDRFFINGMGFKPEHGWNSLQDSWNDPQPGPDGKPALPTTDNTAMKAAIAKNPTRKDVRSFLQGDEVVNFLGRSVYTFLAHFAETQRLDLGVSRPNDLTAPPFFPASKDPNGKRWASAYLYDKGIMGNKYIASSHGKGTYDPDRSSKDYNHVLFGNHLDIVAMQIPHSEMPAEGAIEELALMQRAKVINAFEVAVDRFFQEGGHLYGQKEHTGDVRKAYSQALLKIEEILSKGTAFRATDVNAQESLWEAMSIEQRAAQITESIIALEADGIDMGGLHPDRWVSPHQWQKHFWRKKDKKTGRRIASSTDLPRGRSLADVTKKYRKMRERQEAEANKAVKAAGLTNLAIEHPLPVDGWILPDGSFVDASSLAHETAIRNWVKANPVKGGKAHPFIDPFVDMSLEDLGGNFTLAGLSVGLVRQAKEGRRLWIEGSPNKAQLAAAMDVAIEYQRILMQDTYVMQVMSGSAQSARKSPKVLYEPLGSAGGQVFTRAVQEGTASPKIMMGPIQRRWKAGFDPAGGLRDLEATREAISFIASPDEQAATEITDIVKRIRAKGKPRSLHSETEIPTDVSVIAGAAEAQMAAINELMSMTARLVETYSEEEQDSEMFQSIIRDLQTMPKKTEKIGGIGGIVKQLIKTKTVEMAPALEALEGYINEDRAISDYQPGHPHQMIASKILWQLLDGMKHKAMKASEDSRTNLENSKKKIDEESVHISKLSDRKRAFDQSKAAAVLHKRVRKLINDGIATELLAKLNRPIDTINYQEQGQKIDSGKLFNVLEKIVNDGREVETMKTVDAMNYIGSLVRSEEIGMDRNHDGLATAAITLMLTGGGVAQTHFTIAMRVARNKALVGMDEDWGLVRRMANDSDFEAVPIKGAFETLLKQVLTHRRAHALAGEGLDHDKLRASIADRAIEHYDKRIDKLKNFFGETPPVDLFEGADVKYVKWELGEDGKVTGAISEDTFKYKIASTGSDSDIAHSKQMMQIAQEMREIVDSDIFKAQYADRPGQRNYLLGLANELSARPIGVLHHLSHLGMKMGMFESIGKNFSRAGPLGKFIAEAINGSNKFYSEHRYRVGAQGQRVSESLSDLHAALDPGSAGGLTKFIREFYQRAIHWYGVNPQHWGDMTAAASTLWRDFTERRVMGLEYGPAASSNPKFKAFLHMIKMTEQANSALSDLKKGQGLAVRDEEMNTISFLTDRPDKLYRREMNLGVQTFPRALDKVTLREGRDSLLLNPADPASEAILQSVINQLKNAIDAHAANPEESDNPRNVLEQLLGKNFHDIFSQNFLDPFLTEVSAHARPFTMTAGEVTKLLTPEDVRTAWLSQTDSLPGVKVLHMIEDLATVTGHDAENESEFMELALDFLTQLNQRSSWLKNAFNTMEKSSQDRDMDPNKIIYGRAMDSSLHNRALSQHLPQRFWRYSTFDEITSNQFLGQVAQASFFGRRGDKIRRAMETLIGPDGGLRVAVDQYNAIAVQAGLRELSDRGQPDTFYGRKKRKRVQQVTNPETGNKYTWKEFEAIRVKAGVHADVVIANQALHAFLQDTESWNYDNKATLEALQTMAWGAVNQPKTMFTALMTMGDIVKRLGLNPEALRAVADTTVGLPREIAGTFLERFGMTMATSQYEKQLSHFFVDIEKTLPMRQRLADIGKGGELSAAPFRRFLRQMRGFVETTGGAANRAALVEEGKGPHFVVGSLRTAFTVPFSYMSQAVNKSLTMSIVKMLDRRVSNAAAVLDDFEIDVNAADRQLTPEELGYKDTWLDRWVMGRKETTEWLDGRLSEEGLSITTMAQDFRRRRKEDPDALPLTKKGAYAAWSIAMAEVTYDTMSGRSRLLSSGKGKFYAPLLSWSMTSLGQGVDQMRAPDGKMAMRQSLRYMLVSAAWLTPLSIALTLWTDWWDEKILGKPSNLRKIAPIAGAPVIGIPLAMTDPRWDTFAMVERSLRASNTFGFGQEVLSQVLGGFDSTTRGADYSRRVLAIGAITNAAASAKNYMMALDTGDPATFIPDYSQVIRPLFFSVGLNGMLQHAQTATNLFPYLEDVPGLSHERRVANIIGMRNTLRAHAKVLGMEMRTSSGFQLMPSAASVAVRRMERAAYANDTEDFLESYRTALAVSKAVDPYKDVMDKFKTRNIKNGITQYSMSDGDWITLLSVLTPDERAKIQKAVDAHNYYLMLIGGQPRVSRKQTTQYSEELRRLALY